MYKFYTGLLTILFGLTALPAKAQTVPFLEEGKTWTMEHLDGPYFDRRSILEKLTIEGDTVIAGRMWKKMYLTGYDNHELAAVLYEENGKVYILPYLGATEGKLLYDFSLKKDEEATCFNPDYLNYLPDEEHFYSRDREVLVKATDTETLSRQATDLNSFTVLIDAYNTLQFVEWIEGVGNVYNPLSYSHIVLLGGHGFHLLECRAGDRVLYKSPEGRAFYNLFVEDNKMWRVERRRKCDLENDTDNPSVFERYVIEGDTVIGKKTWKKLYSIKEESGEKTLLSVLREEGGATRILPYAGAEQEKKLYSLYDPQAEANIQYAHLRMNAGGWPASKEEYEEKYVTYTIQDTLIVESNGRYFSIFNVSDAADAQRKDTYMESVGSLTDPFRVTDEDYVSHVVECSVGDKVIYSEKVWKEPSTGIENVCGESGSAGGNAVYDLSGRRLHQKPAHGVYIRNGKKHIVR